jgi:predicted house-cleaning NTP pyrophosphatase (Maf/HAM1 superfamily)
MFLLASASPARRRLLRGHSFRVEPSGVREVVLRGPRATALENARRKAAAAARRHPDLWVLAADTVVAFRGRIYGKPRDRKAALRWWSLMAGKTHLLGTGVVLQKGSFRIERYAVSKVRLRAAADVARLLRTHDPTKYAGGYAIRTAKAPGKPGGIDLSPKDPLVASIEGSVTNVIGLPLEVVEPLLANL